MKRARFSPTATAPIPKIPANQIRLVWGFESSTPLATLAELAFDSLNATLHVICQLVNPKAQDLPSPRLHFSIPQYVSNFSVSRCVGVPTSSVNLDVYFPALRVQR